MKRELELLRVKMKETGVDACLIPTSEIILNAENIYPDLPVLQAP